MTTSLDVLYEDNHLLVVNKPAGISTMGAESGPTVHSLAAEYLKRKYNKPGRVFVGIVSRLDTMTSGVIVLARTSKAASRLSAQFAAKTELTADLPIDTNATSKSLPAPKQAGSRKWYLATVEGHLDEALGTFVDQIRKDDAARRMRLVGNNMPDGQRAALRYGVIKEGDAWTSVAIELLTGRKHQIRVQFADRGHPVIGDRKYKSNRSFSKGIALHSWRLQITHPTKQIPLSFEAPLPSQWKAFRDRLQTPDAVRQSVEQALNSRLDPDQCEAWEGNT